MNVLKNGKIRLLNFFRDIGSSGDVGCLLVVAGFNLPLCHDGLMPERDV